MCKKLLTVSIAIDEVFIILRHFIDFFKDFFIVLLLQVELESVEDGVLSPKQSKVKKLFTWFQCNCL